MNETLSVCIPAYNEEEKILKCLESVSAQKSVVVGEILVGINSSTDSTSEIVERYALKDARVRVVDSPKGKANAWNALNAAARNKLRIFQDGDTTALDDAYATLLAELKEKDIVGASLQRVLSDRTFINRVINFPSKHVRPYPVLNGALYLMDYGKLLDSMRERTGLSQMPTNTINDDAFLQLVAAKTSVSDKVFVRFEVRSTIEGEVTRFRRMRVGDELLKREFPVLYTEREDRLERPGKLRELIFALKAATCTEILLYPFMTSLKFLVYRSIHKKASAAAPTGSVTWK